MNYGELKNLVKQYLHREDLTDYIPSWLEWAHGIIQKNKICLLYTSPSPRDLSTSRMPSSAW